MEQNIILWLKSLYDILIGKDMMKFLSLTSTTSTTITTTTVMDDLEKEIDCQHSKLIQQELLPQTLESSTEKPLLLSSPSPLSSLSSKSCRQQQQQQTDLNNNQNHNEQIHSNQSSIESYHTTTKTTTKIPETIPSIIVNNNNSNQQQQQYCDNCVQKSQQQQQQNLDEKFYLKLSKFYSKPQASSLLSSSSSIRSDRFIEIMIDAYRKHLPDQCDPLIIDDYRDHLLNSFVTIQTHQYRIYGLRNVMKTSEDGFIRFLGNNRFVLNFTVLISDLKIQLDCQLKIGHRLQPKRLSLRNKHYEMDFIKCLLYVELLIDCDEQSIRFERLLPISQQYGHHVHSNQLSSSSSSYKSSSLSSLPTAASTFASCHFMSFNNLFAILIERYFKNYFATNLNHLETIINRKLSDNVNDNNSHISTSFILDYDKLIVQTSLHKILIILKQQQQQSPSSSIKSNKF
ncbi:uncharacterized protein LOC113794845 [Dermatophagoides pteronyssinus]|uniref:Uncharacterized protein LOC113794845 n=1 Tax=Dermatophagoides pteronyssinus TaxID=6956 RepID=A0A6P6Y703_DERPT|nr:uncharacterized protein LOC113794845 [Dermatophagoides pteronyssinus]